MKRLFRLKLAWSLVLIHFIFGAVVVAQLPTYDEVGCDEAVVPSSLDGSVAGRMFYYNYSSSVGAGLMLVQIFRRS